MNRDDLLAGLRPSPEERAAMDARVQALLAACATAMDDAGLQGTPTVQGSVAKDTWIAGNTDLDCFLLLDPDTPEDALKQAAEAVGTAVLDDPRRKYAQHPYLLGTFQGADVDLVPAYRIADTATKMSAVDRTPFHTAWVRKHLKDAERDDVRLLKQWCKGTGLYGAETAIGGFSGYLLEVLVHLHGGFDGVLAWFQAACTPRRLTAGADQVDDDVSPLVVVDPVDATRNCAAAVQADTLQRAAEAAAAFAYAPDVRFFHPTPPKAEDAQHLAEAMARRNETWVGVVARPVTDRLDIVFPQFQKAGRTVAAELARAGFPVHRHHVEEFTDGAVGMQWVAADAELPPTRLHRGPAPDQEPNAAGFRKKWERHPDALGPLAAVDGRLQVEVAVRERTPSAWLQANLARISFGKHVAKALHGQSVLDAPADVPEPWAATVADHVLDRRPWQR